MLAEPARPRKLGKSCTFLAEGRASEQATIERRAKQDSARITRPNNLTTVAKARPQLSFGSSKVRTLRISARETRAPFTARVIGVGMTHEQNLCGSLAFPEKSLLGLPSLRKARGGGQRFAGALLYQRLECPRIGTHSEQLFCWLSCRFRIRKRLSGHRLDLRTCYGLPLSRSLPSGAALVWTASTEVGSSP